MTYGETEGVDEVGLYIDRQELIGLFFCLDTVVCFGCCRLEDVGCLGIV